MVKKDRQMFPDQKITISYPEIADCADHETTWAQFVEANEAETVADVLAQLIGSHYAEIGGGSEPLVWVFA